MGLPCSSSLKTQQEETYRAWWLSGFPSILAAKSGELQESEDKTTVSFLSHCLLCATDHKANVTYRNC